MRICDTMYYMFFVVGLGAFNILQPQLPPSSNPVMQGFGMAKNLCSKNMQTPCGHAVAGPTARTPSVNHEGHLGCL